MKPQQKEIRTYYNAVFEVHAKRREESGCVDLTECPAKYLRILDVHSGRSYIEKFFRYIKICPGKTVLDIGCGVGHLLHIAERKGLLTWGIDISDKAVEVARENTKPSHITHGNAECLPYKNGFFDYVTCVGVLEHLLNQTNAIREMKRVCADEGRMLIVVPNIPIMESLKTFFKEEKIQLQATDQIYETVCSLKEWKNLLEDGGLRVLEAYKDNHTWIKESYSLKDRIRILRRAIRKMLPLKFSYQFVFLCA